MLSFVVFLLFAHRISFPVFVFHGSFNPALRVLLFFPVDYDLQRGGDSCLSCSSCCVSFLLSFVEATSLLRSLLKASTHYRSLGVFRGGLAAPHPSYTHIHTQPFADGFTFPTMPRRVVVLLSFTLPRKVARKPPLILFSVFLRVVVFLRSDTA